MKLTKQNRLHAFYHLTTKEISYLKHVLWSSGKLTTYEKHFSYVIV